MKASLRGRSLEIDLNADHKQVIEQLAKKGLGGKYVEALASAAVLLADEETNSLSRQLIPADTWPGTVVFRRHQVEGTCAYLMLKHGRNGWKLDSALFD
jgi:hypothetical protein